VQILVDLMHTAFFNLGSLRYSQIKSIVLSITMI
jgi:hypothetical protein